MNKTTFHTCISIECIDLFRVLCIGRSALMAPAVVNNSVSNSKKRGPWSQFLGTGSFSWPRSLALVMASVYRLLICFCMDYAIVLMSLLFCTLLREMLLLPLLLAPVVSWCILYLEEDPLVVVLNVGIGKGQGLTVALLLLVLCTLFQELFSLLLLLAAVVAWCVLYRAQRMLPVVFNKAVLTFLALALLTTPVVLLSGYTQIINVALAVASVIVVVHAALHGLNGVV